MRWRTLAASFALLGCLTGWQAPVIAGSDSSADTWAGDYLLLGLPQGTILAINYTGIRNSDSYIQNPNNIFGKAFGQPQNMNSSVSLFTDIARFLYITSLFDHPLALEAAIPYVDVAGGAQLGTVPVTTNDGFRDAYLFFDYGLIVEPKNERYLAFTNYFVIPTGNYNKFKVVNVSTPDQFTDVPQIALNEGLGKYGLQKFWFDIYANTSLHSDGGSPVASLPGLQFDKLTQENSYNLEAFLRYSFDNTTFIALGIEKSWGGNRIASGGVLGAFYGPTSLGEDDFLKGHFQAQWPVSQDFLMGIDITHDFEREGGLREDFTAELRLVKLFLPAKEPLK